MVLFAACESETLELYRRWSSKPCPKSFTQKPIGPLSKRLWMPTSIKACGVSKRTCVHSSNELAGTGCLLATSIYSTAGPELSILMLGVAGTACSGGSNFKTLGSPYGSSADTIPHSAQRSIPNSTELSCRRITRSGATTFRPTTGPAPVTFLAREARLVQGVEVPILNFRCRTGGRKSVVSSRISRAITCPNCSKLSSCCTAVSSSSTSNGPFDPRWSLGKRATSC